MAPAPPFAFPFPNPALLFRLLTAWAYAQLTSLAKLADVRANEAGMTLLHFIAMQLATHQPSLLEELGALSAKLREVRAEDGGGGTWVTSVSGHRSPCSLCSPVEQIPSKEQN
jgi:hypothetical protein